MKIVLVHNRYQLAGGEDVVVDAERALLQANGHEVFVLERSNLGIRGLAQRARTALGAIHSPGARKRLAAELRRLQPHVVHVHNFFPLWSPSIYYACRDAGLPVIQTLHNYRLLCPNALFFRDGHACEDCMGKSVPWPGVAHACYRHSRLATAPVAAMLAAHRLAGTWTRLVDTYIALTEFSRAKFIEGGLPAEKIVVKPHFVDPVPAVGEGRGGYALYVGRLSVEKGIGTMLDAWKRLGAKWPLKVVGDGPLTPTVVGAARQGAGIEPLGRLPRHRVVELMQDAAVFIFPSLWYETFGMTLIEAYAVGLPVIASNLGVMSSLVQHRRTGLHFRPGDAADLAAQVEWALSHPAELDQMRRNARAEFELKYTAQRNHEMLMQIYQTGIGRAQSRYNTR